MAENLLPLIGALVVGFLAFLFAKKTQRGKKEPQGPPENAVTGAARATVQQTFEEEVDGIRDDTRGDDPAGDLADRGNARNR